MRSRLATAFLSALWLLALATPANANFPGGNGRIAFVRGNQVWTMNADGSDQLQVTNEPNGRAAGGPRWSADGTRIVYVSGPAALGPVCGVIEVINADGSGKSQVADGGVDGAACDPSWSPDGSKLAYVRQYEGGPDCQLFGELRIVNVDGTTTSCL